MPNRDRTGPCGCGTMTGRGNGCCTDNGSMRFARNHEYRRQNFRNTLENSFAPETEKELLDLEKNFLKNRLEIITKALDNVPSESEKTDM